MFLKFSKQDESILTKINSETYDISDIEIKHLVYLNESPLYVKFIKNNVAYAIQSASNTLFDIDLDFNKNEFSNHSIEISKKDDKTMISFLFNRVSKISVTCDDYVIEKL